MVDVFKDIQGIEGGKIKIRISFKHQEIKAFDIETDDELKFPEIGNQLVNLMFSIFIENIFLSVINNAAADAHAVGTVPAADFRGRSLGFKIEYTKCRYWG